MGTKVMPIETSEIADVRLGGRYINAVMHFRGKGARDEGIPSVRRRKNMLGRMVCRAIAPFESRGLQEQLSCFPSQPPTPHWRLFHPMLMLVNCILAA